MDKITCKLTALGFKIQKDGEELHLTKGSIMVTSQGIDEAPYDIIRILEGWIIVLKAEQKIQNEEIKKLNEIINA